MKHSEGFVPLVDGARTRIKETESAVHLSKGVIERAIEARFSDKNAALVLAFKRVLRRAFGAAVVFIRLSFALAAQAPSPEVVQRGAQQYQQSCAFCHGPDATGARGPDLIRSKLVADDVNGNLIGQVIRNGRPDKGMPPLPLSTDQIQAIAAFLHAQAQEDLNSARLPKTYALSKLLTGNSTAGEAYFNGAGGCKGCHSATGELGHIATKYPPLELEARMLYPEKAPSATVTVSLPSGAQVKGSLVYLDEFSVVVRDSAGWCRSFSRDEVKVDVHDPLAAHQALLNKITMDEFHNLFAYLETLK
jgi:cytochrome c oxidase cbb3-type subunit III